MPLPINRHLLGIGGTITQFTVVNAVVLRSLGSDDAHERVIRASPS
jgi:hypothetical protein